MMDIKKLLRVSGVPIFVASLCCVIPVVVVLFGIGSVSLGIGLSEVLFGEYDWAFILSGLALLLISTIVFIRHDLGVCTLDGARKKRDVIINLAMLVFSFAVFGYLVWTYVIVELLGTWLGVW